MHTCQTCSQRALTPKCALFFSVMSLHRPSPVANSSLATAAATLAAAVTYSDLRKRSSFAILSARLPMTNLHGSLSLSTMANCVRHLPHALIQASL